MRGEGFGGSAGLPPYIDADGATDADGRFRFTTLPDLPVKLHARRLAERNIPTVQPGQAADVTIQGDVVPWHAEKLKAQEAGDRR